MNTSNKRIAKNTILLYFRMLLVMVVSLYTVRVVLDTLGAVDYGIYNVVGGVVIMLSFLSNTMSTASQRFFTIELGRGDYVQLKKTFSMTMTIYLMVGGAILLLAETLGLWFLNSQMTIPPDRIEAANWVYQFSILSFMMTMITIPYNAAIVAHERMSVYAFVSVIEVSLKLLVVYILVTFPFDNLILYGFFMFCVTTIVTYIYRSYCKRKFEECQFSFYWDKKLFNEIVSYSGWNLFGVSAVLLKTQGINILLNVFFGPVVNASRAVVVQIQGTIDRFYLNLQTAINPQIMKSYSIRDFDRMLSLVYRSSKLSFFLLYSLYLPIIIEAPHILAWWLREVPAHSVSFLRLTIATSLVESLTGPIVTAVQATGNIRKYQIIIGSIFLLIIPLSYIAASLGSTPEVVFVITFLITVIAAIIRIFLIKSLFPFDVMNYFKYVVEKVSLVACLAPVLPLLFYLTIDQALIRFFVVFLTSFLSVALWIYFFGLAKDEKTFVLNKFLLVKNKFNKIS